jgi:hypothetical protein
MAGLIADIECLRMVSGPLTFSRSQAICFLTYIELHDNQEKILFRGSCVFTKVLISKSPNKREETKLWKKSAINIL